MRPAARIIVRRHDPLEHTLSAAQVRQPMHRHRPTAAGYGTLLDPLREALGLPPFAAHRGELPG
jgi:hypothetical protein